MIGAPSVAVANFVSEYGGRKRFVVGPVDIDDDADIGPHQYGAPACYLAGNVELVEQFRADFQHVVAGYRLLDKRSLERMIVTGRRVPLRSLMVPRKGRPHKEN